MRFIVSITKWEFYNTLKFWQKKLSFSELDTILLQMMSKTMQYFSPILLTLMRLQLLNKSFLLGFHSNAMKHPIISTGNYQRNSIYYYYVGKSFFVSCHDELETLPNSIIISKCQNIKVSLLGQYGPGNQMPQSIKNSLIIFFVR